mmetsp:Transcript_45345/g.98680  ORF Transcript_45345/g.98680 Transcript_45345/m.98680 type:complete len:219 (+) Transcript_45345:1242-1898(+)
MMEKVTKGESLVCAAERGSCSPLAHTAVTISSRPALRTMSSRSFSIPLAPHLRTERINGCVAFWNATCAWCAAMQSLPAGDGSEVGAEADGRSGLTPESDLLSMLCTKAGLTTARLSRNSGRPAPMKFSREILAWVVAPGISCTAMVCWNVCHCSAGGRARAIALKPAFSAKSLGSASSRASASLGATTLSSSFSTLRSRPSFLIVPRTFGGASLRAT